jgi:hypothetical protein
MRRETADERRKTNGGLLKKQAINGKTPLRQRHWQSKNDLRADAIRAWTVWTGQQGRRRMAPARL